MSFEIDEKPLREIKRKLERTIARSEELGNKFNGNEQKFTFHAGWNLGFAEGKADALQDILDMFEDYVVIKQVNGRSK